jgi:uracil DNA glycosylase
MTVREGEANSHQNKGWETFTDAVIEQLASKSDIVYLLWGNPAQSKYVNHAASPNPYSIVSDRLYINHLS